VKRKRRRENEGFKEGRGGAWGGGGEGDRGIRLGVVTNDVSLNILFGFPIPFIFCPPNGSSLNDGFRPRRGEGGDSIMLVKVRS
jgi:hypothetical protein